MMRSLWEGKEAVDFDGDYFSFKGAYSWPKPHGRIRSSALHRWTQSRCCSASRPVG